MDNLTAHKSKDYNKNILKTIPYYECFHKETISLIKNHNINCKRWLDTGCGTGTFIAEAYEDFKDTSFILADVSEAMLDIAKEKLSYIPSDKLEYLICSSQELSMQLSEKVDVITAIQVHHYLHEKERKIATKSIYESLNDGGIYVTFENMRFSSEETINLGLKRWKEFQLNAGRSEDDVENHIKRFDNNYFPITLEEHIKVLKEAGFKYCEVFWVSQMQCGLFAIK